MFKLLIRRDFSRPVTLHLLTCFWTASEKIIRQVEGPTERAAAYLAKEARPHPVLRHPVVRHEGRVQQWQDLRVYQRVLLPTSSWRGLVSFLLQLNDKDPKIAPEKH